MFEESDFFNDEGNFKIPIGFTYEYFDEDIYNIPNGFMDFFYKNPPPDRNHLKKLEEDIKEQIPVLYDLGFGTDYNTDANGKIITLGENNDEETIKMIKNIISTIFWTQNIIEKIKSQLRKRQNVM
jgi:hypothetical protein